MSADLLARLIAAGTPADLVGEVAMEFGRAQAERAALERRRESDTRRKRDQRKREAHVSRDDTGPHVTAGDDTGPHVTAGDGADPSLDKENPPDPLKKLNPTAPNEASASSSPQTANGRATRLPDGFEVPADWRGWAAGEFGWDRASIDEEAASFTDHWRSKPGKDGRKLDWQATWRNWCRHSRRPRSAPSSRRDEAPPRDPAILALVERQAAEEPGAKLIRDALKRELGERTYAAWLNETVIALANDHRSLTITAATAFYRDQMKENLAERVGTIVERELGVSPCRIDFQIAGRAPPAEIRISKPRNGRVRPIGLVAADVARAWKIPA